MIVRIERLFVEEITRGGKKKATKKRDKIIVLRRDRYDVSRDGESFPALEPQCLASPRDS